MIVEQNKTAVEEANEIAMKIDAFLISEAGTQMTDEEYQFCIKAEEVFFAVRNRGVVSVRAA